MSKKTTQDSLSFFAQWFGLLLLAVGIAIEFIFVVISDLMGAHILLGFHELEFEVLGIALIVFGFILDLNYNHL